MNKHKGYPLVLINAQIPDKIGFIDGDIYWIDLFHNVGETTKHRSLHSSRKHDNPDTVRNAINNSSHFPRRKQTNRQQRLV